MEGLGGLGPGPVAARWRWWLAAWPGNHSTLIDLRRKEHAAKLLTAYYVLITLCYCIAGLRSQSRSRSESAILAGVGVGVEVNEVLPTPTPARIASQSIVCVSRMPFCYERQRQSLSEKQF